MVLRAWSNISEDIIAKFFVCCGQTKTSRPEDVTCLKPDRAVHEAFDKVKNLWYLPVVELEALEYDLKKSEENDSSDDETYQIDL